MFKVSQPDSDNLARVQLDAVHLGNEDGSHSLVQGSSVHVDGGADRQHETSDSFVNTQILLQTAEGDGQRASTVGKIQARVDSRIDANIQKHLEHVFHAHLEAVPRAVIQAWKMPRKKVKGFFLTITK